MPSLAPSPPLPPRLTRCAVAQRTSDTTMNVGVVPRATAAVPPARPVEEQASRNILRVEEQASRNVRTRSYRHFVVHLLDARTHLTTSAVSLTAASFRFRVSCFSTSFSDATRFFSSSYDIAPPVAPDAEIQLSYFLFELS